MSKLIICVFSLLFSVFAIAAGDGSPPPPERAADCIKKHKDAVACFTGQVAYRVLHCKLKVQLGDPSACTTNGEHDLSDFYEATLRRFAKNKDAQSLTKDYYALWRSSMAAVMTGSAQAGRIESELVQKGNRLELEK